MSILMESKPIFLDPLIYLPKFFVFGRLLNFTTLLLQILKVTSNKKARVLKCVGGKGSVCVCESKRD